jgi:hypothetical protein
MTAGGCVTVGLAVWRCLIRTRFTVELDAIQDRREASCFIEQSRRVAATAHPHHFAGAMAG